MHRAQQDVDESTSFTSFSSLHELKVSQDGKGLLDFSVNDHVQKQRTNDSDGVGLLSWWLILINTNIDQEEDGYENLYSKHNEALLKSETLLEG